MVSVPRTLSAHDQTAVQYYSFALVPMRRMVTRLHCGAVMLRTHAAHGPGRRELGGGPARMGTRLMRRIQ